jgi:small-conductance mechanosensitive channel
MWCWRSERTVIGRARPALIAVCIELVIVVRPAVAQAPAPPDARLTEAVPSSASAELAYMNRPVTRLRARVLTHMPADRVRAAETILDALVDAAVAGPVSTRSVSGVTFVRVADHDVLELVPADADAAAGETPETQARAAADRLTLALAEAVEARSPGRIARASALTLLATAVSLTLLVWLALALARGRRHLVGAARNRLGPRSGTVQMAAVSRIAGGLVTSIYAIAVMLSGYWWLAFSLRQFPYTRPWGETLRAHLLHVLGRVALDVARAVPGLLVVAIILAIARLCVQLVSRFFINVERGVIRVRWADPDTAAATRHLVAIMLWLFAVILSYPYLPGSGSDAFKGISVMIGLIVSLGSSGIVNQMMSGLTLVYSHALHVGDVVRIGEHEGTVAGFSLLAVRLRTFQREEITLPNAIVVAHSTMNYTRLAPQGGLFLAIGVTIGYDAPWRQVRALLLLAASRTTNVAPQPAPVAFQEALGDFAVRYRLLVCLQDAADRVLTRDRLLANIQDAFNEHDVQIMSPHYVTDAENAKVIPRRDWHAPPAGAQD